MRAWICHASHVSSLLRTAGVHASNHATGPGRTRGIAPRSHGAGGGDDGRPHLGLDLTRLWIRPLPDPTNAGSISPDQEHNKVRIFDCSLFPSLTVSIACSIVRQGWCAMKAGRRLSTLGIVLIVLGSAGCAGGSG